MQTKYQLSKNHVQKRKDSFFYTKHKDLFGMFFLFLFCTNFMDVGVYLPILLLPAALVYLFKGKFNFKFWTIVFFLVLFGLSFGMTSLMYGFSTKGNLLMYAIYPFTFFVLGYKLVEENSYTTLMQYLMVIIGSLTLFGFVSVQKTINLFGDMDTAAYAMKGRFVLNMWTGNALSATVLNMRLSLGSSLLPVILLPKNNNDPHTNKIKLFSLICFLLSIYSTAQLGNRTGLAIVIISMLASFFMSEKFNKRKLKGFLRLSFLIVILNGVYKSNLFGIKDIWLRTVLAQRFLNTNSFEDIRFTAWKEAFLGIFTNPLGGKSTSLSLGYAHNLWLDVGYESGIVPFVILLVITFFSLFVLIKLLRKSSSSLLKTMFLSIYSAMLITFFLEPVIQAWFSYFALYCFMFGIVYSINIKNKKSPVID